MQNIKLDFNISNQALEEQYWLTPNCPGSPMPVRALWPFDCSFRTFFVLSFFLLFISILGSVSISLAMAARGLKLAWLGAGVPLLYFCILWIFRRQRVIGESVSRNMQVKDLCLPTVFSKKLVAILINLWVFCALGVLYIIMLTIARTPGVAYLYQGLWSYAALAMVATALWLFILMRGRAISRTRELIRHRAENGSCVSCGMPLRRDAPHGKTTCSECGRQYWLDSDLYIKAFAVEIEHGLWS